MLTESQAVTLSLLLSLVRLQQWIVVPSVQQLAAGTGRARSSRVITEAAEALAVLSTAARRDAEAKTLLRPADASDDTCLLRPASKPPSDAQETLLRAGGTEAQADESPVTERQSP